MKKLLIILFILVVGCKDLYEVPSTVQLTVLVKYPDSFNNGTPMPNAIVKITNKQTKREYQNTTDESGTATFEVRGGSYDIIVSHAEKQEIDTYGHLVQKTVHFNGSANNQLIIASNEIITIQTISFSLNEGFVIKELYVSGSRTPEGKNYKADLFVELYNNSEKELYSDGLCFGTVFPTLTTRPTPYVDIEGNLLPRIPCWGFIGIIPGSGNEYPVQPGESIVIALTGINHKEDPNGNPNSIDLSLANWEFCVENNGYYIDSPNVPNLLMQRITDGVRAMIFDVKGQPSILFRLPSKNIEEIFTNPNNFMIEPGGSERTFMVPKEWVIDGVDNVRLNETVFKRLPDDIDLGYIQHQGTGENVSIRRKVKEVVDGRVIYQDTNNSTEDFLTNQIPQPGIISPN